jgi:hypothetical protein
VEDQELQGVLKSEVILTENRNRYVDYQEPSHFSLKSKLLANWVEGKI